MAAGRWDTLLWFPGFLERDTGDFERVTFCPGFARGLTFVGNYAVVGISLPRHDPTFQDLSVQENLNAAKVSARCGLLIIDLGSGDVVQWMRMEEPIRELYNVMVLPGVHRPRLVGFKTDEIRNVVWPDPAAVAFFRSTGYQRTHFYIQKTEKRQNERFLDSLQDPNARDFGVTANSRFTQRPHEKQSSNPLWLHRPSGFRFGNKPHR